MEDNKNTKGYEEQNLRCNEIARDLTKEDLQTTIDVDGTTLANKSEIDSSKANCLPESNCKSEETKCDEPSSKVAELNLYDEKRQLEVEASDADEEENEEHDSEEEKTESKKKKVFFTPSKIASMSYAQVVDAVGLLLQQDELPKEKDIDMLESAFVRKKEELEKDEEKTEELQDAKVQALRLNDLIAAYRIRYKEYKEEQERLESEALDKKNEIISRFKELVESTEDFGTVTRKFREIEAEWKESGNFYGESFKDLQEQYSALRDSFYDLKQLNDEFRDLDFKKNLEAKEDLIAKAEELSNSNNPVAANREIGNLHLRWKEIGPVAKEKRDEIWERFAAFSKVVRDRAQEFFNNRKDEEDKNLEEKKNICEAVEDIPYDTLKTVKDWNTKKDQVIKLQQDWKEIGPVPKGESNAIYKRFRAACDVFFSQRAIAFKEFYDEQDENYRAKLALVEEAESLAESSDWNKTADRLKILQKEWNAIGFPGQKHRNLWPRFRTACDTFFNARKDRFKERRKEEETIADKKKEYIEKAQAMLEQEVSDDSTEKQAFADNLFKIIEDFKESGRLPLRYTQKLHNKFYTTTNEIFKKWKLDQASRKLENFSERVDQLVSDGDKDKLRNEMTYNLRRREKLAEDLSTSKGSMEFITSSSNWGDNMLKDIEKKNKAIEREIELLDEKVKLLREKLAALRATNKE